LAKLLHPSALGFGVDAVREEGLHAARNGVDFSQLFIGLSFFILIAGLTLLALLFNLHIEKRTSETGTLHAMGFTKRMIQRYYMLEGLIIAVPGMILGGVLGIAYNSLVFSALRTTWQDIVRTDMLQVDIRWSTLAVGMGISLILVLSTIWLNIRRKLKRSAAQLQKGFSESTSGRLLIWFKWIGTILGLSAIAMLAAQWIGGSSLNTGMFFSAGGLLLLSLLLWSAAITLGPRADSTRHYSLKSLTIANIHRNGPRSLRIIVLFALGTFVVISTGLNRKDLHTGSMDKKSGTGGFLFYGETTMPTLGDLNSQEVRNQKALDLPLQFLQMRKTDGDDASCLNLNRVTQPRILGVPSEALNGRFSFVKKTNALDIDQPWMSLKNELPGGYIPAIADQTVIQWGLGKKVGDTLEYRNASGETFTLKLIGSIANSIFQGNMLIDESHFLQQFPYSSGTHVFLVDGDRENAVEAREILERAFRNDGLELTLTADRLATFNRIEDTYLSIFLLLGGLGMILGAIGLGITLARNILDRRKELAILRSMGYKIRTILALLSGEHLLLLTVGTGAGAVTAIIATLPSVLSSYVEASWTTALVIFTLIIVNGLVWTLAIGLSHLGKNLLESLRTE
jgi:ABC-type antimicrobial peptide transport system permease subunit